MPTILVAYITQNHTSREQHHHQRPLFHCLPSTPPSSAINPAIIVAHVIAHVITHVVPCRFLLSTPTIAAQVIAHRHRCRSPPPPSSMSSNDNAAYPLLTPLPPLPPHQTDVVNKIIAKVVSMQSAIKYAGKNLILQFFATSQLNCGMYFWNRGLLMVLACMQKKM